MQVEMDQSEAICINCWSRKKNENLVGANTHSERNYAEVLESNNQKNWIKFWKF